MSPSALNGDETVGSGGPRQKGKATPETLKYVARIVSLLLLLVCHALT
jgi:hypothetical protein